jgi:hypothetical protein
VIDASPKVTCDTAELVGAFDKESGFNIVPVFANQRFDLAFEGIGIGAIQGDCVLTFDRPGHRTIER